MKEIIYPPLEKEIKPSGKVCPSCGGDLISTTIPCPEGKEGCCVAHYGYRCVKCGKFFAED